MSSSAPGSQPSPAPATEAAATQATGSQPTVAIVGASADRSKFGNQSIHAHLSRGYQVFPVNPRGGEIEGLPVHTSIRDIPVARLNRVSVYLPPAVALQVLPDIAAKGCDELWLNPGSDSPEVVAAAEQLGLQPIVACSIIGLRH